MVRLTKIMICEWFSAKYQIRTAVKKKGAVKHPFNDCMV